MLRHLDLFSGIGGFALAARMVGGYETVAFCEIEPYCQAVLRKHWQGVPIYDDVRTFPGVECDVITGGFPCQDISVAGKGAGLGGERSGLWSEFHRIIEQRRPSFALIENVPALRTRGYDRIKSDLEGIDYACRPFVVGADDVGARHRRKRVWIVAYAYEFGVRQLQGRCCGACWTGPLLASDDCESWALADAASARCAEGICAESRAIRDEARRAQSERRSDDVADTRCTLPQERCARDRDGRRAAAIEQLSGSGTAWLTEPDVGRVAHGVPSRVDRLRALGNAIVPQVAAIFLQAIKECSERCSVNA